MTIAPLTAGGGGGGGGLTPPKNFEFDFKIYVKLNMGH